MKLSRRGFAGLAASVPFVGAAAGRAIPTNQAQGYGAIGGMAEQAFNPTPGPLPQAKMEHWQAIRLALADPEMRRQIVSECYERHKIVHCLDHDIANMKSFSPMAKITFQRQRDVERDLAQMTDENRLGGRLNMVANYIQKLMWGDNPP